MNWKDMLTGVKTWLRSGQSNIQKIDVPENSRNLLVAPPSNSAAIQDVREVFEVALREEEELAWRHKSDSYYTDRMSKHNIGDDELSAIRYAKGIESRASQEEEQDPVRHVRRLLHDLEQIKDKFRILEPDVDGYGIGTLHSLTKSLTEAFSGSNSISQVSREEEDSMGRANYFDFEKLLTNLRSDISSYLRMGNWLLALDTGQLYLFALTLKLYRSRHALEPVEILLYTNRLLEARSILLRALGTFQAPKIIFERFYRHIAGLSNILAFVQVEFRDSDGGTNTAEGLPFTAFGFDQTRALAEAARRDASTQEIAHYTEDLPHFAIWCALDEISSNATTEELGFVSRMFPPCFIEPSRGGFQETVLHLLTVKGYGERWDLPDGTIDLWCLKIESRNDGYPCVTGWNAGSNSDICAQIRSITNGAALATDFGPNSKTPEQDEAILFLSRSLWPSEDEDITVGTPITIIAEGSSALIPFAALKKPSGSTWCADHAITIVNRFPDSLRYVRNSFEKSVGSVVVASPSFDPESDDFRNESLKPITHAKREGDTISKLWGWPVITGISATVDATLAALRLYPVVHIASHGALNEDTSGFDLDNAADNPAAFFIAGRTFMDSSAIILANSHNDDVATCQLGSAILGAERWESSQLVFLSLCKGSDGKALGSEAPFGIARALRLAGTKHVIASIYPIDDEIACDFAILFHEALHAGEMPAEALRLSQLALAKRGYRWHAWAGYQLLC